MEPDAHPNPPTIRPVAAADHDDVVDLWRRCGLTRPWIEARDELDRKLAHDPSGLLVAVGEARVVGTVMVGFEGHRAWVTTWRSSPACAAAASVAG